MYVMLTLRIVFVIVDISLIPNSRGDIILIYGANASYLQKKYLRWETGNDSALGY